MVKLKTKKLKLKTGGTSEGGPVLWDETMEGFNMSVPPFAECPVFIGFLTEVRPSADKFKPSFVSTAVKEETKQKQTEEFNTLFAEEAKNTPYLGLVKQVIVTGPTGRPDQVYKLMPHADTVYDLNSSTTPSMTVGRKFGMWSQALLQSNSKVKFVGFNVRTFAKMIAYEAAESEMPLVNSNVWFASDYYDTEHILIPRTPSHWPQLLELRTALYCLCRPFLTYENIATYKPGRHPAVDAVLSMYVCARLRLFDEAFLEGGLRWQEAGEMLKEEVARTQRRFSAKGTKDGPRT